MSKNLGPKTKKNLEEALAGESMARNKYDWFASAAKKEGYVQMQNIFMETALNEKEHAKLWAKELDLISDSTLENLVAAAAGEFHEYTEMYVRMAKEAEEEGHDDLAHSFTMVANAEKAHEARYNKLIENIKAGWVFKRAEEKRWKCNNCGYIHTGKEAPQECPTCHHPQAHFELFCETY
ncbi:MAG: rubrerythrin family protein [Planctomycetes bacterium]|jgi:rubrerythrin|nr:rubrerythrin family protein [Planctomycetota bacterium]